MDAFSVFIVEDDPFYGNLLQYHLSLNPDYKVTLFESGKACLNQLHEKPDVVCIDFGLPNMKGDILLRKLGEYNNKLPVVVISGQEDVSIAVNLLKNGAIDYIIKDDNTKDILWKSIAKIRENLSLKQEVESLKEELGIKYNFDQLIGESKRMHSTFALMEKAVSSNINVSISGETGTGKEVVAKSIHYSSDRKSKRFVAVNMAAIPTELVESELFGHEKGAFTGAHAQKTGQFELANKGTLFLDEIGEMNIAIQSKILRALQEREFTRVGGSKVIKFDVRLITATHRDLVSEVREGNFREDLFYRIMGLPISLPSLNKREEDVLLLADSFVKEHVKKNKSKAISIDRLAKKKMLEYQWPGNVRELKAVIDLACVMCNDNKIQAEDINFANLGGKVGVSYEGKTLKEFADEVILDCLENNDHNVLKVAKILDIGKSTIYNLLKEAEKVKHEIICTELLISLLKN